MKSVHCNKRDHEAGGHEAEAVVSRGRVEAEVDANAIEAKAEASFLGGIPGCLKVQT